MPQSVYTLASQWHRFLQGVRYKAGRVVREADPYGCVTRGAVRRAGFIECV